MSSLIRRALDHTLSFLLRKVAARFVAIPLRRRSQLRAQFRQDGFPAVRRAAVAAGAMLAVARMAAAASW